MLLGEGLAAKFLAPKNGEQRGGVSLARIQQDIAQDGPGKDLLYRAINGFDLKKRSEKKDVEIITETAISQTLAALKASGCT